MRVQHGRIDDATLGQPLPLGVCRQLKFPDYVVRSERLAGDARHFRAYEQKFVYQILDV